MSDKIDWENRAREVLDGMNAWDTPETCRAAVALGVEMADARAEEIAEKCLEQASILSSPVAPSSLDQRGLRHAAAIARSTIQESELSLGKRGYAAPALTVAHDGTLSGTLPCGHPVVTIDHEPGNQLPFCEGCRRASEEPKTRELVLEEALRRLLVDAEKHGGYVASVQIRNALEWKPPQ